jgi:hypothetical protein
MSVLISVIGLIFVGAGILGVGYGWRRRRQRNAIASTETTDVLRLAPGPAEVVGVAERSEDGTLSAPFSQEECLLAEWEIEEGEESGKTSSWRTEGKGTVTTPFYVDDGTDQVLVRPGEATVDLSARRETVHVGVEEEPPNPIRRFLSLDSTPGNPNEALIGALDWGTQVATGSTTSDCWKPAMRCTSTGLQPESAQRRSVLTISNWSSQPTTAIRTPRYSSLPIARSRNSLLTDGIGCCMPPPVRSRLSLVSG